MYAAFGMHGTMGVTATDYNPTPFNPDPNYNPDPNDEDRMAAIQILGSPVNEIHYDWSVYESGEDAFVGTWLVREYGAVEASAPATFGLFILALAGLAFRRK